MSFYFDYYYLNEQVTFVENLNIKDNELVTCHAHSLQNYYLKLSCLFCIKKKFIIVQCTLNSEHG